MRNVFFTLSIVLLLSVVGTNSDPFHPDFAQCTEANMIGACEIDSSTNEIADSIYYGPCRFTIHYKRLLCIDPNYNVHFTYMQIGAIAMNPGNCTNVMQMLYDDPNDSDTFKEDEYVKLIDSLYTLLYERDFSGIEDQYECPDAMTYSYFWPGTCMMVCQYRLGNGNWTFTQHSCIDEGEQACCGKSVSYCKQYDPLQQIDTLVVDETIIWVGTACPVQTVPYFDKCEFAVGDLIAGQEVAEVVASYCVSSCYDE